MKRDDPYATVRAMGPWYLGVLACLGLATAGILFDLVLREQEPTSSWLLMGGFVGAFVCGAGMIATNIYMDFRND